MVAIVLINLNECSNLEGRPPKIKIDITKEKLLYFYVQGIRDTFYEDKCEWLAIWEFGKGNLWN